MASLGSHPYTGQRLLRRALKSDFLTHGAWIFGSTIFVNAFNYLYHFFMTRYLGPQGYGVLSSVVAATMLGGVPALIATSVLVKFTSEFSALEQPGRIRSLYRGAFKLLTLCAAAFFVIAFALRMQIAAFLHVTDTTLITLGALAISLTIVVPAFRGILQGAQDFKRLALSLAYEIIAKAALGIGLVLAGLGLRGALLGYVGGTLIGTLYAYFALGTVRVAAPQTVRIDWSRLAKTSLGISLSTLGIAALSSVDVILVKHYFSATDAGLYGAMALAGKTMIFVVGFLPQLILPKASARAASGSSALPVLLQGIAAAVALLGAGLLVLFFFPALALRILAGPAYLAAAPNLFAYATAMSLLGVIQIIANYLIGIHRYAFVIPLLAGTVAEIVLIGLRHDSLYQVVLTVFVVQVAILAVVAFLAVGRVRAQHVLARSN